MPPPSAATTSSQRSVSTNRSTPGWPQTTDAAAATTSTPEYFSVGPAEVTPVDTTGAGDAFNGGLAAALSRVRAKTSANFTVASRAPIR